MNKILFAIALAFALALPMAPTKVQADPWYSVNIYGTTLWQHSFGRGSVRCHVDPGQPLYRHWGDNWARWIYVRTGKLAWDCRGWVDKRDLSPHVDVPASKAWFQVNRNYVELKTQPGYGRGNLKCQVPHSEYLHRDNSASVNNDEWIYVRWKEVAPVRSSGSDYQGQRGECAGWNLHGWVPKKSLVQTTRP